MPAHLPIVTIDGPAGVGKTTLARALAEKLAISYLDTGAMFRTLAYALGEIGDSVPEEKVRDFLHLHPFALKGFGSATTLLCRGVEVSDAIRTEEIGSRASHLAKNALVRSLLAKAQQNIGQSTALVAEGRDMGTVIFPEARVKFFLDARPEVRGMRRCLDLTRKGLPADLATITEQIIARDQQDRNRPIAPLVPAKDAILLDTSDVTQDVVLDWMLTAIDKLGGCAIFH